MSPLRVLNVQPDRRLVPANVTRVHVTFSQPVLPGTVGDSVALEDIRGVIRLPMASGERWNIDRTRLTFELSPTNEQDLAFPLGGLLHEGHHYRIVIEPGALSISGTELAEPFEQVFLAGPAITTPVDPSTWKFAAPTPGSTEPLVLAFPRPMDLMGLERLIRVVDATGRSQRGSSQFNAGGTSWWWQPDQAWADGFYAVRIDTDLRDVCGNNLVRAADDARPTHAHNLMPVDLGFCLGPIPAPSAAPITRRVPMPEGNAEVA